MAKKKKSADAGKTAASFESSLADLESVVGELERGDLSLDESLSTYESGVKHLRACYAALQKAEGQIRLLVDIDDAGNARLNKFASGQSSEADDVEDEIEDEDDFSDEDPNEESTLF